VSIGPYPLGNDSRKYRCSRSQVTVLFIRKSPTGSCVVPESVTSQDERATLRPMASTRSLSLLCCLPLFAQDRVETHATQLHALLNLAPRLALTRTPLQIHPPGKGWELGMVSWVAMDSKGVIYILQRGDKADPVIALNGEGTVLRSWGRGMYIMPHALRIDPQGNVWTTDAASSKVLKFTPDGKKLMEISVGGLPKVCPGNFCGTTDLAFAPNGHIFISDGYANARVIEYTGDGNKVREWGEPGTGPGQFHLLHSIQIDENGAIYVADREKFYSSMHGDAIASRACMQHGSGEVHGPMQCYALAVAAIMRWGHWRPVFFRKGSATCVVLRLIVL
jgi:streptogramin lyase